MLDGSVELTLLEGDMSGGDFFVVGGVMVTGQSIVVT